MNETNLKNEKISITERGKLKIQELCEDFWQSPQNIEPYLEFASRFYDYSARNIMLMYMQNHNARFVGSKTKFQQMGYTLKPAEYNNPIWIIRTEKKQFFNRGAEVLPIENATPDERKMLAERTLPISTRAYFYPARVYDLSQTDCPVEKYPEICDSRISPADYKELYERMAVLVKLGGISITFETNSRDAYYISKLGTIYLPDSFNDAERLCALNKNWVYCMSYNNRQWRDFNELDFEVAAVSKILQYRLNLPQNLKTGWLSNPIERLERMCSYKCMMDSSDRDKYNLQEILCRITKHANFITEKLELSEFHQPRKNNIALQQTIDINQAFMQGI